MHEAIYLHAMQADGRSNILIVGPVFYCHNKTYIYVASLAKPVSKVKVLVMPCS